MTDRDIVERLNSTAISSYAPQRERDLMREAAAELTQLRERLEKQDEQIGKGSVANHELRERVAVLEGSNKQLRKHLIRAGRQITTQTFGPAADNYRKAQEETRIEEGSKELERQLSERQPKVSEAMNKVLERYPPPWKYCSGMMGSWVEDATGRKLWSDADPDEAGHMSLPESIVKLLPLLAAALEGEE